MLGTGPGTATGYTDYPGLVRGLVQWSSEHWS